MLKAGGGWRTAGQEETQAIIEISHLALFPKQSELAPGHPKDTPVPSHHGTQLLPALL